MWLLCTSGEGFETTQQIQVCGVEWSALAARTLPAGLAAFAVVPFVMTRHDSIPSQLCTRPRVRPMRGGREDGRPQAHIAGSRLRPLENVFS